MAPTTPPQKHAAVAGDSGYHSRQDESPTANFTKTLHHYLIQKGVDPALAVQQEAADILRRVQNLAFYQSNADAGKVLTPTVEETLKQQQRLGSEEAAEKTKSLANPFYYDAPETAATKADRASMPPPPLPAYAVAGADPFTDYEYQAPAVYDDDKGSDYAPSMPGTPRDSPMASPTKEDFIPPIHASTQALLDASPLAALQPATDSITLNPTKRYLDFMTDYIENIALRFATVCILLVRFDRLEDALALGQYAVDFLGSTTWRIALAHYINDTTDGDDLIAAKMCMADLIHFIGREFQKKRGEQLQDLVLQAGMWYYRDGPAPYQDVDEMEI